MANDPHNELKSTFFSNIASQLNKCLEPSMQCTNKAIRAHSVQNSKVLDLLSRNGHVMQVKFKVSGDKPPELEYKSVGRNQATTFMGLCSAHDRIIFEDIDIKDIDINNKRQLFLLSYRSVLRELHATMDSAVSIQSAFQKRVELGLDPKNTPSTAGMEAVSHMLRAWRTYRYKCKFDEIENDDQYDNLIHFTKIVESHIPTVAASVFYEIGEYTGEEDIIGVTFNIVPLDATKMLIVLSCLQEHQVCMKREHIELYEAEDHYFKYLISKLLLKHGENFVVNPEYFSKWPEEKQEKILDYFSVTMFNARHDEESEHLYLF